MSFIDTVIDACNDFWGEEDESEDIDNPCVNCRQDSQPTENERKDLDEWMSFDSGKRKITQLEIDQTVKCSYCYI